MRESGRYQLQMLKTRSSAAVGRKLDLNFNVASLVITDKDDDDLATAAQTPKTGPSLRGDLKEAVKSEAPPKMTPVDVPEGGSTRDSLMAMINKHKPRS